MSSTFLYKAYQQIDSHMVKSNAMVSTKTNSQRCLQGKFIEKRLFPWIETNIESVYYKNNNTSHLKVSFQHSWPFCPKEPTPYLIEWLLDHHEFLGLVLWHKQLYLGVTLSMFNESCFCIWKVPDWIDNSLYLTKLSNAPSRATLRGLMSP